MTPKTPKEISLLHSRLMYSPPWNRAAAFSVLPPQLSDQIRPCLALGRIQVAYPANEHGYTHVFLYDCSGTPVQYGRAIGTGLETVATALAGLTFDGIQIIDKGLDGWRYQLAAHSYQVVQVL